jgi:hypothetical protein
LRTGGFCRLEPDLFKIFVTENDDDNQRGSGNDIVLSTILDSALQLLAVYSL